MIEWRPRAYNVQADHLANSAMNSAQSWRHIDFTKAREIMVRGGNLRIYSDGGYRAAEGRASAAWVLYGIRRQGGSWVYNMVGHAGISIQRPGSAFISECIALESALDALVDVIF